MVRQTFLNLDEEKQKKFIIAAIEEFAEQGYYLGSIERIAKAAEVSKGSVYQYFDSKKDLYFYLMNYMGDEKLKYIQSNMQPKETFFESYKEMIRVGSMFGFENPLYMNFFEKMMASVADVEIAEYMHSATEKGLEFFKPYVQSFYDKGEFNKEYSVDFIVYIVANSTEQFAKYMMAKHNLTYETMMQDNKWKELHEGGEFESVLGEYIGFLKNGLAK